jgi:hypothetical protein
VIDFGAGVGETSSGCWAWAWLGKLAKTPSISMSDSANLIWLKLFLFIIIGS